MATAGDVARWYAQHGQQMPVATLHHTMPALDFGLLWERVQEWGGYAQVCQGRGWGKIGNTFKPPKGLTTLSHKTKQLYEQHLLQMEPDVGPQRVQQRVREVALEMLEASRQKKLAAAAALGAQKRPPPPSNDAQSKAIMSSSHHGAASNGLGHHPGSNGADGGGGIRGSGSGDGGSSSGGGDAAAGRMHDDEEGDSGGWSGGSGGEAAPKQPAGRGRGRGRWAGHVPKGRGGSGGRSAVAAPAGRGRGRWGGRGRGRGRSRGGRSGARAVAPAASLATSPAGGDGSGDRPSNVNGLGAGNRHSSGGLGAGGSGSGGSKAGVGGNGGNGGGGGGASNGGAGKLGANRMVGGELVGRRVEVHWVVEDEWYPGRVSAFDAQMGTHCVRYDDGDVQDEDLLHGDYRVLPDDPESQAPPTQQPTAQPSAAAAVAPVAPAAPEVASSAPAAKRPRLAAPAVPKVSAAPSTGSRGSGGGHSIAQPQLDVPRSQPLPHTGPAAGLLVALQGGPQIPPRLPPATICSRQPSTSNTFERSGRVTPSSMQQPGSSCSDGGGGGGNSSAAAAGKHSTPGLPPGMVPTSALGTVALAAAPLCAHPGAKLVAAGAAGRLSTHNGDSSGGNGRSQGAQARIDAIRQHLFAEHAGYASAAHALLPASAVSTAQDAGGTAAAAATHLNNAAGLAADGAWGLQATLQRPVPDAGARAPSSKPLQLQHLLSQPAGLQLLQPQHAAVAATGSAGGDSRQAPLVSSQQQQQPQRQQAAGQPGQQQPGHLQFGQQQQQQPQRQQQHGSQPPPGPGGGSGGGAGASQPPADPLLLHDELSHTVLRARDAPDAAYEVFCRTPGVPPTDLRVRVFPPDRLLIETRPRGAPDAWAPAPLRVEVVLPTPVAALSARALADLHGRLFVRVARAPEWVGREPLQRSHAAAAQPLPAAAAAPPATGPPPAAAARPAHLATPPPPPRATAPAVGGPSGAALQQQPAAGQAEQPQLPGIRPQPMDTDDGAAQHIAPAAADAAVPTGVAAVGSAAAAAAAVVPAASDAAAVQTCAAAAAAAAATAVAAAGNLEPEETAAPSEAAAQQVP